MNSIPNLIIQFEKSDAELQEAITTTFGESAEPVEVRGFDGGFLDIVQVAIPVATATLPFLMKYFTAREETKRSRSVVVGPKGDAIIRGYSEAEVVDLLGKITNKTS
jgi:hypothetical protein